jgi:hypothetical protein
LIFPTTSKTAKFGIKTQGTLGVKPIHLYITFFKGGPTDPSLQEKEHPTTSKIHAMLDSYPL